VTVREAFEKAYGPIPEGATCWLGAYAHHLYGIIAAPLMEVPSPAIGDDFSADFVYDEDDGEGWIHWDTVGATKLGNSPICDRPASAFLGFFGDKYDRVVSEDQAAWRAALHGARVSVSDLEDDGA
jgi:hypothetical protein